MRLIFKGKILKDEMTLDEYKITDGLTIHMVKGKSAGGAGASSANPTQPASSLDGAGAGAAGAGLGGAGAGLGGAGAAQPNPFAAMGGMGGMQGMGGMGGMPGMGGGMPGMGG